MYLGIDLGTSNSAVVGHLNGTTRLFKAADGSDGYKKPREDWRSGVDT